MNKKSLNPAPWILRWLPAFAGVLIVVLSAATISAVFLAMADSAVKPDPFLSIDYWTGKNENTSRSEVVRNLGLVLAAFIGIGIALWRLILAGKQQTLAERGLITDRINKAIENLGHQAVEVKLGGIHALWRLIEEIPGRDENARRRDVKMILDILTSFVRHDEEGRVIRDKKRTSLRIDVETAVRLLGDKSAPYRSIVPDYKLNFRGANLSGARLDDCYFHNALLFLANLSNAALLQTNFSRADLAFVGFNGACVRGATLTDADLSGADFTGAIGMTQKQIDSAFWDGKYMLELPEGIVLPPKKPVEEE